MANNITEVRLIHVPLEKDYMHTFYFQNVAAQTNYFLGKSTTERTYQNLSYQRKDSFIRIPDQYDSLLSCNYVMYKNAAHSDKWFYAFITDMQYIDEGRTDVYIETDVIQTWLFNYNIKESFIEREHVDDDTTGKHTVPEMLETGEFVSNIAYCDTSLQDYVYIVQVTEDSNGEAIYSTNFGGVWVAGGAYLCETGEELVSIINLFGTEGKSSAVTGVYLVPKRIVNNSSGTMQYSGQSAPVTYEYELAKQTVIDGYTPRNNKVLCYPYNYILLSNNAGNSNILQYENFALDKCYFEISGVPTVGGSVKCTPKNYKGCDKAQQEGIMLGKFPTCSWSSDLYTNWLTQNGVNLGLGIASGGLQVVGGLALMGTGAGALAGAGSVASGALSIASTLGQKYQMSFTPNSAEGNTNGGDINTCSKTNMFYFYKMSIKAEYAKIIDNYFDMFGYKVNRVKKPSAGHRENYWYTKTIDVNIDGAIPQKDLQKIKDCYNNGITFWYTPANIGNYSVSNLPCG